MTSVSKHPDSRSAPQRLQFCSGHQVSPFHLIWFTNQCVCCVLTWDVCAVVLDVHLVQAGLSRRVLHCDRPVQVVCDQRLS